MQQAARVHSVKKRPSYNDDPKIVCVDLFGSAAAAAVGVGLLRQPALVEDEEGHLGQPDQLFLHPTM